MGGLHSRKLASWLGEGCRWENVKQNLGCFKYLVSILDAQAGKGGKVGERRGHHIAFSCSLRTGKYKNVHAFTHLRF